MYKIICDSRSMLTYSIKVVFSATFAFVEAVDIDSSASSNTEGSLSLESLQPLAKAASAFGPLYSRSHEQRYVPYADTSGYGGYRGYGGLIDPNLGYKSVYHSPHSTRIFSGLDTYSAGYNSYNSPFNYGSNNLKPYNSYYNGYLAGYPYNRPGHGYNSYPSSYYTSNYANNIVGGGFGGIGPAGILQTLPGRQELGSGYQIGPSISGAIY